VWEFSNGSHIRVSTPREITVNSIALADKPPVAPYTANPHPQAAVYLWFVTRRVRTKLSE